MKFFVQVVLIPSLIGFAATIVLYFIGMLILHTIGTCAALVYVVMEFILAIGLWRKFNALDHHEIDSEHHEPK